MQFIAFAASLGLLVTVTVFDYATGYELLLQLFYLLPVTCAAWFGGRTAAWVISALAAIAWMTVDCYDGHKYTSEFYRYWNGAMFFGTFAVVGSLLGRLKATLDHVKKLLAENEEALRELNESTLRLRRLEGSFQTMCAWTNLIKDGDEWINFQEFLFRHLHIRLTHSISPKGIKLMNAKRDQGRGESENTSAPL